MKKTRLYNVIFPIWMLFLFPQVWLIALPGNLLIDCAVVLFTLMALKHTQKKAVLKQVGWKIWFLGFAADFVGVAVLFPAMFLTSAVSKDVRPLIEPVMYNCWKSPLAFLWTAAAVALSGVCIYFFDRRAMRSCEYLTDRERHLTALSLAIITAPWMFFIPTY
ncbi:MAG: hypothetical protein IKB79_03780 [Oscillospiraceae bacterium]|nr:hypothetical protein [Oscillospiraceae bacterium]